MRIEAIDTLTVRRLRSGILENNASTPPFKLDIVALNSWLNALPFTNPALACKMLSQALSGLNSCNITGTLRLQLIEEIRPFTLSLLKAHEDKLLISKFPLIQETKELVQASISLQELLGTAYSKVILSNEFTMPSSRRYFKKTSAPFEPTKQAFVIYRALESLGLVLLKSAQSYQTEPNNTWDKINLFFQLAIKNNISQLSINIPSDSSDTTASIEGIFKSLHFFHLASPNRFDQREITSIYNLLTESEKLIKLSTNCVIKGETAFFYADISSSLPATHTSKITNESLSHLFFHLGTFLGQLSEQASSNEHLGGTIINSVNKQTRLPAHTTRRLLQCWNHIPVRQFTREENQQEATLYPNLQNVIKKLFSVAKVNRAIKTVKSNEFNISALELVPLDATAATTYTQTVRSESMVESLLKGSGGLDNPDELDIWQQNSKKQPEGEAEYFKSITCNSSAKGYQVNLSGQLVSQIKAGDLIGISLDGPTLEIAVIRRMTMLADGSLSLGLELIAPHAEIVKIINKSDTIRSRYVLMLPAIPSINQAVSILSPSPIKLPDNIINISRKRLKETYRIQKLLESNSAFSQYSLAKGSKQIEASSWQAIQT